MINEFAREMKFIHIFLILTGNLTESQQASEFGEREEGGRKKPTKV